MSDYPISCITCRRRKIKCNKKKPCNQCLRKGIVCEFPSKFRNISIPSDGESHDYGQNYSNYHHARSSNSNSNSPNEFSRLHDEVELLRKEKLSILHENFKLSQKNNELRSKLQTLDRSFNAEQDEHGIEIAGETTELGEKYYGPSSSNYMIEALRQKNASTANGHSSENGANSDTPKKMDPSPPSSSNNNTINNNNHNNNNHPSSSGMDTDSAPAPAVSFKKALPWVLHEKASSSENIAVIKYLASLFFEHSAYRSFISRPVILDFINNFDSIPDREWENDDDLLLLHMVLVLLVLRLTPKTYAESGLDPTPLESMAALQKRCSKLISTVLFRGFTRLRHNLLNESVMTVQAYILCTEYYFIDQRYEEAWSMLFHCCAVSFAIGLHVMVNMRTTNDSLEDAPVKLAEMSQKDELKDESADGGVKLEDSDSVSGSDDDDDGDVPRFKVWFALKYMCGQLCSVLGRPNPLSIQVNSVVLFSSNENNLNKIQLNSKKTQVQLKMGLSECLRLSNMMLIESFMINFTINDVMKLDARFKEECEKLTWFISGEYQDHQSTSADSVDTTCHMPLAVEREPALIDLIILHINRAKLLEPFSNQFLDPEDSKYLMDAMCGSILKFLDYQQDFTEDFLRRIKPQLSKDGKAVSKIKLGKIFRMDYPFLNSFMYQGIIVIFTLLNYKAKEFVQLEDDTFLRHTELKLNELLQMSSRITEELGEDVRLWSTNIMYLINKDLQHINTLMSKRTTEKNDANDAVNFNDDEDLDKVLGISFKDPFWLNAENIPYYLSSPSDDGFGTGMFEDEPYNNTPGPVQQQQQPPQPQPQQPPQQPPQQQPPQQPGQQQLPVQQMVPHYNTDFPMWTQQPQLQLQFRQLQQPLPLTGSQPSSLFLLSRQPTYHQQTQPPPNEAALGLTLGSQEPLPIPQVPMPGHPNVTRHVHQQQPLSRNQGEAQGLQHFNQMNPEQNEKDEEELMRQRLYAQSLFYPPNNGFGG